MKFSMTTALGWARFAFCVALLGHILFTVFAHGIYFIDEKAAAAYVVVFLLADKLLGAVQGHFTADAQPAATQTPQ